jgi:hypothetical protein
VLHGYDANDINSRDNLQKDAKKKGGRGQKTYHVHMKKKWVAMLFTETILQIDAANRGDGDNAFKGEDNNDNGDP